MPFASSTDSSTRRKCKGIRASNLIFESCFNHSGPQLSAFVSGSQLAPNYSHVELPLGFHQIIKAMINTIFPNLQRAQPLSRHTTLQVGYMSLR
jgi:hypothetical protein